MFFWPLVLTLYAGFIHAFETDHLLAVSAIVTRRKRTIIAIKDGLYWGLGHTSTIFFIGLIFFAMKMKIGQELFRYFEAGVGLMLILIGIYRIAKWYERKHNGVTATAGDNHRHENSASADAKRHPETKRSRSFIPTYLVGLIHGLAGSGVLMLAVMAKSETVEDSLLYLLLFGIGSIVGMMLAAGLFNLPFSQKALENKGLKVILIFLSALLCIGYGVYLINVNFLAL